jgi:hypothetical protein
MIQDTRPLADQVRSGLKIAAVLVTLCGILVVIATFVSMPRIEAWMWHWKYGNTIQVGKFSVPVPNEWGVQRFESGMSDEVQLSNIEGGKSLWATVTITQEWRQPNTVLADLATSRRHMMESRGTHVSDPRKLVVDGVSGFCIDGISTVAEISVRNISCYLGTTFSMEYIGSSLKAPAFYSILANISQASKP